LHLHIPLIRLTFPLLALQVPPTRSCLLC